MPRTGKASAIRREISDYPLHKACFDKIDGNKEETIHQRMSVISGILEKNPEFVLVKDFKGQLPLQVLAQGNLDDKDCIEIARSLIGKKKFDIDCSDAKITDYLGVRTPLHFAILKGKLELAEYLIKNGADINCATEYNGTIFHEIAACCREEDEEVIKEKIKFAINNSEPELSEKAGDDGVTATFNAYRYDNLKFLKHFVDFPDFKQSPEELQNGIITCAQFKSERILKHFLGELNKLDHDIISDIINAQDEDGFCAFFVAMMVNEDEEKIKRDNVVRLLLNQNHLNLSLKNSSGETFLHQAANQKLDLDVTETILRKMKSDKILEEIINAQNNLGNTALHNACVKGDIGMIKLLRQFGASITVKNHDNRYPVSYLEEGELKNSMKQEVMKIIRDQIEKVKKDEENRKRLDVSNMARQELEKEEEQKRKQAEAEKETAKKAAEESNRLLVEQKMAKAKARQEAEEEKMRKQVETAKKAELENKQRREELARQYARDTELERRKAKDRLLNKQLTEQIIELEGNIPQVDALAREIEREQLANDEVGRIIEQILQEESERIAREEHQRQEYDRAEKQLAARLASEKEANDRAAQKVAEAYARAHAEKDRMLRHAVAAANANPQPQAGPTHDYMDEQKYLVNLHKLLQWEREELLKSKTLIDTLTEANKILGRENNQLYEKNLIMARRIAELEARERSYSTPPAQPYTSARGDLDLISPTLIDEGRGTSVGPTPSPASSDHRSRVVPITPGRARFSRPLEKLPVRILPDDLETTSNPGDLGPNRFRDFDRPDRSFARDDIEVNKFPSNSRPLDVRNSRSVYYRKSRSPITFTTEVRDDDSLISPAASPAGSAVASPNRPNKTRQL